MLRKVRLFFYNNKKIILTSVGLFIFIVVIIQVLNYNARRNSEEELAKQNGKKVIAECSYAKKILEK